MPFKSKAQQRWMFANEAKGKLPKGTAKRWAEHTPDMKSLPEQVKAAIDKLVDRDALLFRAAIDSFVPTEKTAQAPVVQTPFDKAMAVFMDAAGPALVQRMAKVATIPASLLPPKVESDLQIMLNRQQQQRQQQSPPLPGMGAGNSVPQQAAQVIAGAGQPPTQLGGGSAPGVPGTPGHAATNTIDRNGGLDPNGRTVDGNNAAGIAKAAAVAVLPPQIMAALQQAMAQQQLQQGQSPGQSAAQAVQGGPAAQPQQGQPQSDPVGDIIRQMAAARGGNYAPVPPLGKVAAVHAVGTPLPKDWNGPKPTSTVSNGGVTTYGKTAWESTSKYVRPNQGKAGTPFADAFHHTKTAMAPALRGNQGAQGNIQLSPPPIAKPPEHIPLSPPPIARPPMQLSPPPIRNPNSAHIPLSPPPILNPNIQAAKPPAPPMAPPAVPPVIPSATGFEDDPAPELPPLPSPDQELAGIQQRVAQIGQPMNPPPRGSVPTWPAVAGPPASQVKGLATMKQAGTGYTAVITRPSSGVPKGPGRPYTYADLLRAGRPGAKML